MALVILATIAAEFAAESKSGTAYVVDETIIRLSSKCLTYLLLQPASSRLPLSSPHRRLAVDLIGSGFTVWEPYLDGSAVLLGLLGYTIIDDTSTVLVDDAEISAISVLPHDADLCRSARRALERIVFSSAQTVIITLAKEVARYNNMVSNSQITQLEMSVIVKSKPELLRLIRLLIEQLPDETIDRLPELMDVMLHSLDLSSVRIRGLRDVFPAVCRLPMLAYCAITRRICIGLRSGQLGVYDLRQPRIQSVSAHSGTVATVEFSPDGKFIASYSAVDNRLIMWQASQSSLFGIGSHAGLKLVKTFDIPPPQPEVTKNISKLARFGWSDHRTVILCVNSLPEMKYRI